MNKTTNIIKNRLSLRQPQTDSLEILSNICDSIELKKNPDLVSDLEKVKELYPSIIDFERQFPSLCFALATGVGKTRLMGAFIRNCLANPKSDGRVVSNFTGKCDYTLKKYF